MKSAHPLPYGLFLTLTLANTHEASYRTSPFERRPEKLRAPPGSIPAPW
jgi:hypothetical protein